MFSVAAAIEQHAVSLVLSVFVGSDEQHRRYKDKRGTDHKDVERTRKSHG